jgi:hypothetical protein
LPCQAYPKSLNIKISHTKRRHYFTGGATAAGNRTKFANLTTINFTKDALTQPDDAALASNFDQNQPILRHIVLSKTSLN